MFFTTKSSTAMSTSMMSSLEKAVIMINGKKHIVNYDDDNEVDSYSMWGMSKWGTSKGSKGGIPRSGMPDHNHK